MREPYAHCQCDNCSGADCGQDNPEECERMEKERDAAIRKEERERVLDELVKICKIEIKWWDECGTRIMHEGGIAANRHIINWAESLYGKEQP